MARAQIKINGSDSRFTAVAIGGAVALSNDDNGGETTYAWTLVDQPEGTADTLSATNVRDVTLTPTKEGSYELLLTVNGTLTTTAVVAVLDARTGERIPAATETDETGTAEGWARALKPILARALHASVDGNVVVARTPGGIAAGAVVSLTSQVTMNSGTQAAFDVTSIAVALGTATHADRLGVLVDGVTPGSLGAGSLVLVRMFGLVAGSGAGSPAVGDPVYLSNTGTAALTPGTVPRTIGAVVASSGGLYRWVIDSGVGIRPAGGYLGTQVLTASSGTYTPTTGTTRIHVKMIGGGGGGGGAKATGNTAAGQGGNTGTLLEFWAGSAGVNIAGGAYACGAGGTAGMTTPTAGGTGGDTTLTAGGTTYIAKGGTGGQAGTNLASGSFLIQSNAANAAGTSAPALGWSSFWWGIPAFNNSGFAWSSGNGGTSPLGSGGNAVGGSNAGINGSGNGAGGSGGAFGGTGASAGGAGASGIIVIDEYA